MLCYLISIVTVIETSFVRMNNSLNNLRCNFVARGLMLLCIMSFLHKGIILLILTNSGIGIISKEGNNHNSILSFHVHRFLCTRAVWGGLMHS